MTTSIGTIAGSGVSTQAVQATAASTVANSSNQTASQIIAQTETVSLSPHVVIDPVAGIITQYLSSSGKLEAQFPSTTVVAYLKAGLTAQGLIRPEAPTQSTTVA